MALDTKPRTAKQLAWSIMDALDRLHYARAEGDSLKIDLCEAALNDLLDEYSCHGCHGSQTERVKA